MLQPNRIVSAACAVLKVPRRKVRLSINLVGDAKMRSLNKKYRNKDKVADVLSFPLFTSREIALLLGSRGILELGDLFVNRRLMAKKPWLVVHGLLHLFGFDHEISSKKAKKMFSLEDKILKKLSYGQSNNLRN